jgi:hypothetical protein
MAQNGMIARFYIHQCRIIGLLRGIGSQPFLLGAGLVIMLFPCFDSLYN